MRITIVKDIDLSNDAAIVINFDDCINFIYQCRALVEVFYIPKKKKLYGFRNGSTMTLECDLGTFENELKEYNRLANGYDDNTIAFNKLPDKFKFIIDSNYSYKGKLKEIGLKDTPRVDYLG